MSETEISLCMYDYIVKGKTLEQIEYDWRLNRGEASRELRPYMITGKNNNRYRSAFGSGDNRGLYTGGIAKTLRGKDIMITPGFCKKFMRQRYDDETIQEFIERYANKPKFGFKKILLILIILVIGYLVYKNVM